MRDMSGEEGLQKLEKLCKDLEEKDGWSPEAVTRVLADLACFRVQHKTPAEKQTAERKALRRQVLNFLGKGPGNPPNLALYRKVHPKTEQLIGQLEDITDQHMLTHKLRNRSPLYKAYSHLLFQTLVDDGLDLHWQDGLRGLFYELNPLDPPPRKERVRGA